MEEKSVAAPEGERDLSLGSADSQKYRHLYEWVVNTLSARSWSHMKNGHKLTAIAELGGPLV